MIKAIDIPSLLVIGDRDSVVSSEMAAELTTHNPYLKVMQILQAGHGVLYDQPKRFSSVVQDFLQSITNLCPISPSGFSEP